MVTRGMYSAWADPAPDVFVENVPLRRLVGMEVWLHPNTVVLAGIPADGRQATFASRDFYSYDVDRVMDAYELPGATLPTEFGYLDRDAAAERAARLDRGCVRLIVKGKPLTVVTSREVTVEPGAGRIAAGWAGYALLFPVWIAADIVTFPWQAWQGAAGMSRSAH
jgi:hypothetical protein